ncbi:MAG: glycine oxidase ThiO [Pyrinomonadaceae bacterium]|nr:glycine oxidase ThiO [Pyrinomonadaceae bacterium]
MSRRILIIGGGVIGLSIARELRLRGGHDVRVIESGTVGREASWAAAGMLAPNAEADEIDSFYRLCSESNSLFPSFAEELCDETGIDIGLDRTGTLELAFDDKRERALRAKRQQQSAASIEVGVLSPAEIGAIEPAVSANVRMGLEYPNDGQVENRKLVDALVRSARRTGVEIIENRSASDVLIESGRAVGVMSDRGRVESDAVVLATGSWTSYIKIGGVKSSLNVKPIRGQMLSVQGPPGLVKHVIYGAGAYLVPRSDGRILVGATVEDVGFEKEVNPVAIESLRQAAIRTVPAIRELEILESWCGLRPFAADGGPILGPINGIENLVAATAHYRNGILLSPITAKLVTEYLLSGVGSEYFQIFSADRFKTANAVAGDKQ